MIRGERKLERSFESRKGNKSRTKERRGRGRARCYKQVPDKQRLALRAGSKRKTKKTEREKARLRKVFKVSQAF